MTARKQEIQERLRREFDVCDRHIMRINEALLSIGVQVPMSIDVYEDLTAEQIRCVDQFVFRFSKLQDAMGAKIFRYVLALLDEDVDTLPMRDILNRMERYKLISSAEDWVYIRELRNEIAHDYPMMESDLVATINELICRSTTLIDVYDNLKVVAKKLDRCYEV